MLTVQTKFLKSNNQTSKFYDADEKARIRQSKIIRSLLSQTWLKAISLIKPQSLSLVAFLGVLDCISDIPKYFTKPFCRSP